MPFASPKAHREARAFAFLVGFAVLKVGTGEEIQIGGTAEMKIRVGCATVVGLMALVEGFRFFLSHAGRLAYRPLVILGPYLFLLHLGLQALLLGISLTNTLPLRRQHLSDMMTFLESRRLKIYYDQRVPMSNAVHFDDVVG